MLHSEFKGYTPFGTTNIHVLKYRFFDDLERQLIVYYMITEEYIRYSPRVTEFLTNPKEYPLHGNHSPALEHNTRAFIDGIIRAQKPIIEKYFQDHEFNSQELFVGFAIEQSGYDAGHSSVIQKYPNLALVEHTGMRQHEEINILGKIR
jgi:hypothetical protein